MVTYQPLGADLIESKNEEAIAADVLLRGGAGQLQILIERTDLVDTDEIQKTVDRLRDKISKRGQTIGFKTYKRGLLPGQLLPVKLSAYGLDGETFVIDTVEIQDEDKTRMVYNVSAYRAERIRNSIDFFQSLAGGGVPGGGFGGGALYDIIAIVPGTLQTGVDIATHYPVRTPGTLVEWSATSKTSPSAQVKMTVRRNNVPIFAAADVPTIPAGQSPFLAASGSKFISTEQALAFGDIITADCLAAGGARGVTLKLKVRT